MALRSKLDTFLQNWSNHTVDAPEVFNSLNGRLYQERRCVLLYNVHGQQIVLRDNQYRQDTAVGIQLLQTAADRVDAYYIGTQYRKVLKDQRWQTLYQVAPRQYSKVAGTTLSTKMGRTVPCHQCGLVLPLKHITIDHQRPQSGGEDAAILKLLHTLGCHLTHGSAKGGKGRALLNNNLAPVGTKKGRGPQQASDPAPRYTLTDNGIVFVSLALAASGKSKFYNYGMHSLVNLTPVCFRCNAIKSNGFVDLSQINDYVIDYI